MIPVVADRARANRNRGGRGNANPVSTALGDGYATEARPVCENDGRLLRLDRMKGRGEVSFSVNNAFLSGSALNPDAGAEWLRVNALRSETGSSGRDRPG